MTSVDELLNELTAKLDVAFGEAAEFMANELDAILSHQTTIRVTRSGRIVASEPAEPGMPPRRVTGELEGATDYHHDGPGEWSFGIKAGITPFKAVSLETWQNHPYFSVVIDRYGDQVTELVDGHLR